MANSQARWRDRSSATLWIRRARPCACAWRTESDTLTNLLIFLFLVLSFLTFLFLWIYQGYTYRIILRNPKEGALRPRHRGRVQRLPWILEPQDFSRFSDVFPRQTHVKPRLRHKIATAKKSKNFQDASKRLSRCLQEASKTAPKTKCETFSDFNRILVDFGSIFDGFLVDFGLILARFLVDFPSIFGLGFWLVFCSFFNQTFNDF